MLLKQLKKGKTPININEEIDYQKEEEQQQQQKKKKRLKMRLKKMLLMMDLLILKKLIKSVINGIKGDNKMTKLS